MNGSDEGGAIGEGMYFGADGSLKKIYSIDWEENSYKMESINKGENVKG